MDWFLYCNEGHEVWKCVITILNSDFGGGEGNIFVIFQLMVVLQ